MKITASLQGMDDMRAFTAGFSERRINATIATALTRTATQIRDVVKGELPRAFDRPTPYTLNSLFVKPATADSLWSKTYFKDDRATSNAGTPAVNFLLPNVEGGKRKAKRFERALQLSGYMPSGYSVVPGAGAKLDAYGNIAIGQIVQILSQLRVTLVAGSTRNMSFDARKQAAAQRKAGGRFFAVGTGDKRLMPGIYQREFFGRNITPVLLFVPAVSYRPRFDFLGIAQREAETRLTENMRVSIGEQIERLAVKGVRRP